MGSLAKRSLCRDAYGGCRSLLLLCRTVTAGIHGSFRNRLSHDLNHSITHARLFEFDQSIGGSVEFAFGISDFRDNHVIEKLCFNHSQNVCVAKNFAWRIGGPLER